LVVAGLKRLAWTEEELAGRRKGDPAKLELAGELHGKTTVFIAWIAQQLRMGSRSYLACLLQQQKPVNDRRSSGFQYSNLIN